MHGNAEVVLAVFRAIEDRDREALFELYHDDVELYDAPSLPYGYEGVSGKEAMRASSSRRHRRGHGWGPAR